MQTFFPCYAVDEVNDYDHQTELIIDLMVPASDRYGVPLRGIDVAEDRHLEGKAQRYWRVLMFTHYVSHN